MKNRAKIISITNQKGGVGKTTTTISLAAGLAEKGKNCLIVDMDPQGNASTGLGVMPENRNLTTYDILLEGAQADRAIHKTPFSNLSIIPATTDLTSADIGLSAMKERGTVIKSALDALESQHFDYILFDCPPSLNLLTINALIASDSVLVPLQSEFYALEGLSQLILSVREIRNTANPNLRIEGILLTMFDRRNNLSLQVEKDARENLGDLVYNTVIPRNVRISEAPSHAMPVMHYDARSAGSVAYRALVDEFLEKQ